MRNGAQLCGPLARPAKTGLLPRGWWMAEDTGIAPAGSFRRPTTPPDALLDCLSDQRHHETQ